MKKRFLLIIIILLLTGCSTKYELVINEDLTITEEAFLSGTSEFYTNYYKTTKKNVLKTILESYKDVLEENKYEYELVTNTNPYVHLKKKYGNVSEYTEGTILLNGYFDKINYTDAGNIKKIETEGFYENNPEDPNRFYVRELVVSIKCPYKVVNHNASNVNKETNTYYYNLFESKKIVLEYDTSKKYNPNAELYTTLMLLLMIVVVSWLTVFIINKKKR